MNAKKILLPLIAIALLAVSFTSVSAQTSAAGTGSEQQTEAQAQGGLLDLFGRANILKGTYIGKATVPTPQGPLPYIFTQTFHEDGTTESNASLDLVPPAASTARGQYQHLGGNQFAVTTVGTLVNSVTDPTLFGTFKIRELLTFNDRRDQIIDGRVQVDVFDAHGNRLFSFGATVTEPAKLVMVEVLQ